MAYRKWYNPPLMTLKRIGLVSYMLLALFVGQLPGSVRAQSSDNEALGHKPVCAMGNPNQPRCHARVKIDKAGKPQKNSTPAAYTPAQLLGAYNLTGRASQNTTIAIVSAYDHPTILGDLNTYSQEFNLPIMSNCPVSQGTAVSPCFQKIDQRGGVDFPAANSGWGLEIALDVQIVHAICQNCNILLVEADGPNYGDLFAAIDQAVSKGAKIISNSYGSGEWDGEQGWDHHLNVPGVAMIFSSGDGGYGATYPAASPYVTAVGGTTLTLSGNNYVSESAWGGAGSGCSAYELANVWQSNLTNWNKTGCGNRRAVADVSAVADPNTGVAIFYTDPVYGQTGWFKVGGTSLAAPLIAGVYALAGDISSNVPANSLPYLRTNFLQDITSGNNGRCKNNIVMCSASNGYDGPTGLGTPRSSAAF
jgi:subtilase family serine protease